MNATVDRDDVVRWLSENHPTAKLENDQIIFPPPVAGSPLAQAIERAAAVIDRAAERWPESLPTRLARRPAWCGIDPELYATAVLGATAPPTEGSEPPLYSMRELPPAEAGEFHSTAKWLRWAGSRGENIMGFEEFFPESYKKEFDIGARWVGFMPNLETSRKTLAGQDPKSPVDPAQKTHKRGESTPVDRQFLELLGIDVVGRVGQKGVKIYSRHHQRCTVFGDVSRVALAEWSMAIGPAATYYVADVLPEDDQTERKTVRELNVLVGLVAGYEPDVAGEVGQGVWLGRDERGVEDDSILLVASGNAAEWREKRLLAINSPRCRGHRIDFKNSGAPWFFFDRLEFWLQECEKLEFRKKVLSESIDLFGKWRWENPTAPELITALVMATWTQSIWSWRPQIAVIGRSGSGKSYLFTTLEGIFGGLIWRPEPGSTVASIRRAIANSSLVVLMDEFDAEEKHQAAENQRIMKMIRSAGRGGMITRCVGDGIDVTMLRQIFWVAGINVQSEREADVNRLLALELLKPLPGQPLISLPSASRLGELGHKLLALAIWGAAEARNATVSLRNEQIPGAGHRLIESLSVPAAILGVTGGDHEGFAAELLHAFVEPFAIPDDGDDSGFDDKAEEFMLLDTVLGHVVSTKGGESQIVGSIIKDVHAKTVDWGKGANQLETCGVFVENDEKDNPCLLLYLPQIKRQILKNSNWQHSNIQQVLSRLPNAEYLRLRRGGTRRWYLRMPISLAIGD